MYFDNECLIADAIERPIEPDQHTNGIYAAEMMAR